MRNKSLIVSTLAAVAALGTVGTAAQAAAPAATPLPHVSAAAKPGIVYLETTFEAKVYDPSGHAEVGAGRAFPVTYTCTGFFVTPQGDIASAGHCVNYDDEVKADLLTTAADWEYDHGNWPSDITREQVEQYAVNRWQVRAPDYLGGSRPLRIVKAAYGVQLSGLPTGKTLPARVLGSRRFEDGDVSLLKIDAPGDVPTLPLAPSGKIDVGSPVVAVGYPHSVDVVTDQTFDPTFNDGKVSSEKTMDGGARDVIQISAALSPGMSGGPTMDMQGRVVGINSFMPSDENQPFNFVSPVEELRDLMRDKGVAPAQGAEDRLYAAGLNAYFAGDRETAVSSFDSLLRRDASHQMAQDYRARALKLPAAPKESGGVPIGLIALVALILICAVAGVARRRSVPASKIAAPPEAGVAPRPAVSARPAGAPQPVAASQATVTRSIPNRLEEIALNVASGPRAGERIEVGRELSIGRGDDVDLRLDDAQVSRSHALIETTVDGVRLSDLRSSNGTTVNGVQVSVPTTLRHGDVVAIGSSILAVEIGRSARAAATQLARVLA